MMLDKVNKHLVQAEILIKEYIHTHRPFIPEGADISALPVSWILISRALTDIQAAEYSLYHRQRLQKEEEQKHE